MRIGNVPKEWYDQEKNFGYDIKGNPVVKKLDNSRQGSDRQTTDWMSS